jgi:hypothetical protein
VLGPSPILCRLTLSGGFATIGSNRAPTYLRGGTMRRVWLPLVLVILAATTSAQTASANTQVRSVFHIDDTAVDSSLCGFDITFRFVGWVTSTDYYDNSGFLYKTISKGRPGPFRVTATAKGTTLTQQNSSFTETVTYNADGSVRTLTDTGAYNKFTAPGAGIVWLDTGRVVVDGDFNVLFRSGPHQDGDFSAFCGAFG